MLTISPWRSRIYLRMRYLVSPFLSQKNIGPVIMRGEDHRIIASLVKSFIITTRDDPCNKLREFSDWRTRSKWFSPNYLSRLLPMDYVTRCLKKGEELTLAESGRALLFVFVYKGVRRTWKRDITSNRDPRTRMIFSCCCCWLVLCFHSIKTHGLRLWNELQCPSALFVNWTPVERWRIGRRFNGRQEWLHAVE